MKIKLNETRTIPVNPKLLETIMEDYEYWFEGYKEILRHDIKSIEDAKKMKITNKSALELAKKGGVAYLQKLRKDGQHRIMQLNAPVAHYLWYSNDPIIQRRMTREQFNEAIKGKVLTTTFWVHRDDDNAVGYFSREEEQSGLTNMISIRFPWMGYGDRRQWPMIQQAIRHELQHFTQSFYAQLFGLTKWIGLPTKSAVKGRDIHDSPSGKHQDIPVEVATDVQDEIEEFIQDLREVPTKNLKKRIIKFVGLARDEVGVESEIFRHYFETNKDIWKWSVSKLLSAVKGM